MINLHVQTKVTLSQNSDFQSDSSPKNGNQPKQNASNSQKWNGSKKN